MAAKCACAGSSAKTASVSGTAPTRASPAARPSTTNSSKIIEAMPALDRQTDPRGLILNGGSTMFLHTRGTATVLAQGWAELNADAGVIAHVVFTNRIAGLKDQDGTAPAVAATNRILVPYDDASGFATAIAVVNPTATAQNLTVGFRTTSGGVAFGSLPSVPPQGHMAFVLAQQFPVIAGHSGLAEFY